MTSTLLILLVLTITMYASNQSSAQCDPNASPDQCAADGGSGTCFGFDDLVPNAETLYYCVCPIGWGGVYCNIVISRAGPPYLAYGCPTTRLEPQLLIFDYYSNEFPWSSVPQYHLWSSGSLALNRGPDSEGNGGNYPG